MASVSGKKVLVIEHKKPNELRFYLKGESTSYYAKDQGEGIFDIFIEENTGTERKAVDVVRRTYEDYNVENIGQLFVNLHMEPSKYFEMLTFRREDINFVIVIYEDGFDICTTYKQNEETYLSRCFGIYKNEKKISYRFYAIPIPIYEAYTDVDYDYNKLLEKTLENPEDIMDELTVKYVFGVNIEG